MILCTAPSFFFHNTEKYLKIHCRRINRIFFSASNFLSYITSHWSCYRFHMIIWSTLFISYFLAWILWILWIVIMRIFSIFFFPHKVWSLIIIKDLSIINIIKLNLRRVTLPISGHPLYLILVILNHCENHASGRVAYFLFRSKHPSLQPCFIVCEEV